MLLWYGYLMSEYDDSAALMWPAIFPGSDKIEVPHVTVLYLGDKGEVPVSAMAALLVNIDNLAAPGTVATTGLEVFGEDDDRVWVATLDDSVLGPLRARIKERSARYGILDASSYPDYRPHVTLVPYSSEKPKLPRSVTLGPLEMWWGDEHISW